MTLPETLHAPSHILQTEKKKHLGKYFREFMMLACQYLIVGNFHIYNHHNYGTTQSTNHGPLVETRK